LNNEYDISSIVTAVEKKINETLRANLYEAGLGEEDIRRLRNKRNELKNALANCGVGDVNAKAYVKDIIRDIFVNRLKYDTGSYNRIMPFDSSIRLSPEEKFDILLYLYKGEYESDALEELVKKSGVLEENIYETGCDIDKNDIEVLYEKEGVHLKDNEKLDIIVQKIYSAYRGLGVVDEIRDMKIDGVSGGVSGQKDGYDSVWIFYRGINIHLSFLSFGTMEELERVCMNIYRYGNPGQLSKAKGYIIGEMKDHSRVVVVRPPFSESFAFFVRKFDTIDNKEMEELITDRGKELPIDVIRWIVKGCQVAAVTGAQGSGKTTLLMSMIRYISPMYTLRIQESAFELHLRDIYKDRNILTFRETEYIDGQTGLDVQKKTDGAVNILGEVATIEVAAYLIQMSQVGSIFTLFTHHAKTTDSLIKYMRNSLLSCGLFRDEKIAKEQVIEAIRFDIHMEKDINGHRYIERISEIGADDSADGYYISDIVVYENNRYIRKGSFSRKVCEMISKHLDSNEREQFNEKYCV